MAAIPLRSASLRSESFSEAGLLPAIEVSLSRTDANEPPSDAGVCALDPRIARSARFSIAISRALGSVVLTVHGTLEVSGARRLASVLADIIDGQGNLAVIVNLRDAMVIDASSLSVFATAAERARQRGAALTLSHPPEEIRESLSLMGLAHLVAGLDRPAMRTRFPGHLRDE